MRACERLARWLSPRVIPSAFVAGGPPSLDVLPARLLSGCTPLLAGRAPRGLRCPLAIRSQARTGGVLRRALAPAALVLAGCPKQQPAAPAPTAAVLPAVARDWSELRADLYALTPASTVESVRTGHDVWNWTAALTRWGERAVLELVDTDRPTRGVSAAAGWFLDPEPPPRVFQLPDVAFAVGDARVVSVVLRDFGGAPTAESPEALSVALGQVLSPPMRLCRPAQGPVESVVAYDAARRIKVGLSPAGGAWHVDHVEWRAEPHPPDWWTWKGYGRCDDFAEVTAAGKLRTLDAGGAG